MKLVTDLKGKYPTAASPLYDVFDYFSSFSWELCRVRNSNKKIADEETITDLLIAYIETLNMNSFHVIKVNKAKESRVGADLLIIRRVGNKYYAFAIQAKILKDNLTTINQIAKYDLKKLVNVNLSAYGLGKKKILQHRILRFFAKKYGMTPLYSFYNNISGLPNFGKGVTPCKDRCCGQHDYKANDYGVSIATIFNVVRQANSRANHSKSFSSLHKFDDSTPLQSLFCPSFNVNSLPMVRECKNKTIIDIYISRGVSPELSPEELLGIPETVICVGDKT
ncbi:DUF6615 family protein [Photobacterium phosphoreum]|uniref:DUF6615 family protein n=1 Tax=Photobacterium phosphoreum TaxID=659 RepID=UPI001E583233|nr:DUF6615 family protein [Photobacterium phosphoreum]